MHKQLASDPHTNTIHRSLSLTRPARVIPRPQTRPAQVTQRKHLAPPALRASAASHGRREPHLAAPDPLAAAFLLPASGVAAPVHAPPPAAPLQEAEAPAFPAPVDAAAAANAAGRGLLGPPAGARTPGSRCSLRLRRRGGQPRVPGVAGRAAAAPQGRGAALVRPPRQARHRGGGRSLRRPRGSRGWRGASRGGEAARSRAVPPGGDGGRRAHVLGGGAAGGGGVLPERGGAGAPRRDVQSRGLLPVFENSS
jgi:hypothetical protein